MSELYAEIERLTRERDGARDEAERMRRTRDEAIRRLRAVLKKAKPIVGAACAAAGATGSNDARRLREKVYAEICAALGVLG